MNDRVSRLRVRLAEWWWEPSAKIIVAFLIVGIVAAAAFAFGPTRQKWDIWGSKGLGIGWECTSSGGATSICFKDVAPPLQKPKSN